MSSGIRLRDVGKHYASVSILRGINLQVDDHEFVSLLGPSGCGKTTLLRMVAGLESPSEGRIECGSEVVFDAARSIDVPPERRRVAMVFQNYALWPHMTVLQNVAFPLRCQGIPKKKRESQSLQWLTTVRMAELAHRVPAQLSGGQQQRVALARALASNPNILLMDEPLSNLDANLRDEMVQELLRLRTQVRVTVLYVTHDHREALRLSDRVALMNRGVIEQIGTVEQVCERPQTEFVRQFLRT